MLLLLLACVDPGKAPADPADAADSGDPGGDTAPDPDTSDTGDTADTDVTWSTLPATCAPPASVADDPLVLEGEVRVTQTDRSPFMEALDIELVGDVAYAVGQGGLIVFDIADRGAPALLAGPSMQRFHRVEPLAEGFVVTSHRDQGLSFWNVANPAAPAQVGFLSGAGMEGLAYVDGLLWVTVRGEGLRAYDVSNPAAPVETARAAGLSSPWEIAASGDGWLYAADLALGVVPIDIRTPTAPVVGAPVALDGALHPRFADNRLYVAAGAAGVVVLDVASRGAPTVLHTVATGGSAVMTDVANGRLWVADHEGVAVLALGDGAPTPIQRDDTEQFALAVVAEGDRGFVGDWNLFEVWKLTPDLDAGALDLASDTVRFTAGTTRVPITNRGSGPLALTGATSADPAVVIDVSTATLAPGETATLRLTNVTLDTTLCVATDDPDDTTRTLDVRASAAPPAGVPAPDFALTGLDGTVYRLSEQLGAPVLLAYFATW